MAERTQSGSQGGKSEGTSSPAPDPQPTTESQREDGRYEVSYLVANSKSLLDSRPAVVAGALSQEDRKTHTLDQAKELLAKFVKREHDPDEGIA